MEDFGQKYNALATEISKFKPPTMKYTSNTYFSASVMTLLICMGIFIFIYKSC
jgi:hypothetical protein